MRIEKGVGAFLAALCKFRQGPFRRLRSKSRRHCDGGPVFPKAVESEACIEFVLFYALLEIFLVVQGGFYSGCAVSETSKWVTRLAP